MNVSKEKAIEWWIEDLNGELGAEHKKTLQRYLDQDPELREELIESTAIWPELENLETPLPSPAMETRFHAMLEGYQSATENKRTIRESLSRWILVHWQTSLASLSLGLIIGFCSLPGEQNEVKALSEEVSQMKKMLMLSLMEKPQAGERIRAVNLADDISGPDERITSSLVSTLNHDKSLNVRLAALDALLAYGDQENVREALVRSIALQDSPLLQVALADAMILLNEKEAIEEFRSILMAEDVDESVRFKLESTIQTLKKI